MLKISEILELFREESCEHKVDYELTKTETPDNSCFWNFVIYYYTNLWSIEHNEPNELEIIIDDNFFPFRDVAYLGDLVSIFGVNNK